MRFFIVAIGVLFAFPAIADNMRVGGITSQPIGHYRFCVANPEECRFRPLDQRVLALTSETLEAIVTINRSVNDWVIPVFDIDMYGEEEVWAYPTLGVGDCEDYVLEKRRRLSEIGVSLANLLITVVRQPNNEGHAVLTVRTDHGDLILDNLEPEVLSWRDTEYRYSKRQSSFYTGKWVSLQNIATDSYLVATSGK